MITVDEAEKSENEIQEDDSDKDTPMAQENDKSARDQKYTDSQANLHDQEPANSRFIP